MTLEHLLVERDAAVLCVTINRSTVLGALNAATLEEPGTREGATFEPPPRFRGL